MQMNKLHKNLILLVLLKYFKFVQPHVPSEQISRGRRCVVEQGYHDTSAEPRRNILLSRPPPGGRNYTLKSMYCVMFYFS